MLNKIIIELYEQETVKDIINNFKVEDIDKDDLEQEIYCILLEYDSTKIIEMYKKKQLKFFIVGIIQRQYHSKTSPFYKKYKKYYSLLDANKTNNFNECDKEDIDD